MQKQELLVNQEYTYIGRNGTIELQREQVLAEHAITICINGSPAGKITCIPEHLELLVLGRLLTEGMIHSPEDVIHLHISEDAAQVSVELRGESKPLSQPLLKGNHTGNDGYRIAPKMAPVIPIPWKTNWVFALADFFAAGTPLHEITWATHSCILARQDQILFTCEDISRHNALDKVIGFALKNEIPLSDCMVYSSGRIPTDMAAKAVCAGIPILISKASPTAAAVDLAKRYHLTLICAARKDRMKLFSGVMTELE